VAGCSELTCSLTADISVVRPACEGQAEPAMPSLIFAAVPRTARGGLRPCCCSVWWVVVWCWRSGEAGCQRNRKPESTNPNHSRTGLNRIWRCSVFGSSKDGRAGGQKDHLEHRRSDSTNNDREESFASDNYCPSTAVGGDYKCDAEFNRLTHILRTADSQMDVSADVCGSTVDGRAELWSDLRLDRTNNVRSRQWSE
jgi:hypothetical protein